MHPDTLGKKAFSSGSHDPLYQMLFLDLQEQIKACLISVRRKYGVVPGACFGPTETKKIVKSVGYASLVSYFSAILFQHFWKT